MIDASARRRPHLDHLIEIVRSEYREMPGLSLTFDQVKRLWDIETATCRVVLERLLSEGFLTRTPRGNYARWA